MAVLHSDQIQLSILIGQQMQTGNVGTELTNGMVAASGTRAALNAAVLAGPTPPLNADMQPVQNDVVNGLTIGGYTGDVPINPSGLSPATVAQLIAGTQLPTLLRPATGPMILE